MDLLPYFKSMIDQDRCAVVVCDAQHTIIYMNPAAAERYSKHGGSALVGKSVLDCHSPKSCEAIKKVVDRFKSDSGKDIVYTFHNAKENKDVYMVALRDENKNLIGYYEKHEYRDKESMKMYDLS